MSMHKTTFDFVSDPLVRCASEGDDSNPSCCSDENNEVFSDCKKDIFSCRSPEGFQDELQESQGRSRVSTLWEMVDIVPSSVLTALAGIASSHACQAVREFAASFLPMAVDIARTVALRFAKLGDPTYARRLMQNLGSIALPNFSMSGNDECDICTDVSNLGGGNIESILSGTVGDVADTGSRAERIVRDRRDRRRIANGAKADLTGVDDQIPRTSDPGELALLQSDRTRLGQIIFFNA